MSKTLTWKEKAVAATRGNNTQFGAILLAALDGDTREAMRKRFKLRQHPAFASCACVTSDGFLIASFIDRNGEGHQGAFVGAVRDYVTNVKGLTAHLKLNETEREEFHTLMRGWIGTDYRSNPELF